MRRRTLLCGVAVGALWLAGCSSDASTGEETETPTRTATETDAPTPSPTPACGDSTYRDTVGEFSFEYGLKTEDGRSYEGTLRFVHVRTPVCRYEDPPCAAPTEETVLAERSYTITGNLQYDIVDAPVSEDVDSYRIEFTAGGQTVSKRGLEEAARPLVDESFDFLVCNPGARRFGFVVRDGTPRIVRARPDG